MPMVEIKLQQNLFFSSKKVKHVPNSDSSLRKLCKSHFYGLIDCILIITHQKE